MKKSYTILEIEFFSKVEDSIVGRLNNIGLNSSFVAPGDEPVFLSNRRFGTVIEKSGSSLRQDLIDHATALIDTLDKEQKIAAILWERPYKPKEGLPEEELAPRKIYAKGVIAHELTELDLGHSEFQFISDNRVMVFGEKGACVYGLGSHILLKRIKCSHPVKYIELNGNGYLQLFLHKLLFSYDPETFKRNPPLPKLKLHIREFYLYDDSHFILASGKNIYLFNVKTREFRLICTHPYIHDNCVIEDICLSDDRKFLLMDCPSSTCEYGTVIWDLEQEKEHLHVKWRPLNTSDTIYILQNSIVKNAFARCGKSADKNKFYTLEIESKTRMEWTPGGYNILDLSNTGKYTVVNNEHEVELRDPHSDDVLFKSEPFVEKIIRIRFSEDDTRIGVITNEHFFHFDLRDV